VPSTTITITGAVTASPVLTDTGRGILIQRIDVATDVAASLRMFRGADGVTTRLFDLEGSNGIQLYLDDEDHRGFLSSGDIAFTGGTAGEDVTITVDYIDITPEAEDLITVMLPWYNYPNWYDGVPGYVWPAVIAQNTPHSPIIAVINPSSGPGVGGPNADYDVGLEDMRDGGVRIELKRGRFHVDEGGRGFMPRRCTREFSVGA